MCAHTHIHTFNHTDLRVHTSIHARHTDTNAHARTNKSPPQCSHITLVFFSFFHFFSFLLFRLSPLNRSLSLPVFSGTTVSSNCPFSFSPVPNCLFSFAPVPICIFSHPHVCPLVLFLADVFPLAFCLTVLFPASIFLNRSF